MNRFFTSISVCFLLLGWSPAAKTQSYLPNFWQNTTPGLVDYEIPNNVISVFFTMRGAQGGDVNSGCYAAGGKAAALRFRVSVGYCSSGQVKPGGLLRFITAERGQTVTFGLDEAGAGGGGGSAVLYQAPNSVDWQIIAVAGGGGGAAFVYVAIDPNNIPCDPSDGISATRIPGDLSATKGLCLGNVNGQPGSPGNGGNGFEIGSAGGGGAFSDGTSANSYTCAGKKGMPSGGARSTCTVFTAYGGFGFGSGGAGYTAGGGGGGYTGGGGGCYNNGGGAGGSFFGSLALDRVILSSETGGGRIVFYTTTGTYPPPVSLASNSLPPLDVIGCSITQCVDFGLSTSSEKASNLSAFNTAGGVVSSGGCDLQSVSYIDTLDAANPNTVVHRTWKLVDVGGNIVRAKQVITIRRPSLLSTIAPASQTTCINQSGATITTNAVSQFGITVQWYIGEDAIFSNASPIQGALNLSYTPTPQASPGTYYYFCRVTDGCGSAVNKVATVNFLQQAASWYKDADGDNYYDASATVVSCTSPGALYKRLGLLGVDCNDNDNTIYPGAAEICDGKDNNCNGTVDEACCPVGNILYVKQDATGANNGSSWANAYTSLQTALSSPCAQVTQIWVAKGTYKPTATTDRTIAFVMKNNLAIYGGFNGTETQFNTRRPIDNPTILSGDIGIVGNLSDNSYNVVRNDNNSINSTAVLDGFTITGGNASNTSVYTYSRGGGVYSWYTQPTIRNCVISGNNALWYGGGVFSEQGAPVFVNAIIAGNTAQYGAGMYNEVAAPQVINCTFAGNKAIQTGGAMHTFGSVSPQIKNTLIWGNSSGISNNGGTPVFSNCLVQPNSEYLPQDSVFIVKPTPGLGNIGDLRLPPCSPAIDAGNISYFPFTNFYIDYKDIQGNIRDLGGKIDLGAYERSYPFSITYVDSAATGLNDGSSWGNAYTSLDKAIRDMNYCENKPFAHTIYIAKGTYPLNGTATTLLNRSNATLLGGFPTDGSERNPIANPVTILANLKAIKNIQMDGIKIKNP